MSSATPPEKPDRMTATAITFSLFGLVIVGVMMWGMVVAVWR